jgi:hypothetical protein
MTDLIARSLIRQHCEYTVREGDILTSRSPLAGYPVLIAGNLRLAPFHHSPRTFHWPAEL